MLALLFFVYQCYCVADAVWARKVTDGGIFEIFENRYAIIRTASDIGRKDYDRN